MFKSGFKNKYTFEHWRNGVKLWEEEAYNLVVNEGLNDVLQQYFKGANYTAEHFLSFKGAGAVTASDTLAEVGTSTTAWNEITTYAGNRKKLLLEDAFSQAISNNANRAMFTIQGVTSGSGISIAGVMVATVETGYLGKLFSAVDFSVPRTVLNDDSIVVTVEFTQASV